MATEPERNNQAANPYAPPEAEIAVNPVEAESGTQAEAERVRRKYLSHEASVKSVGSLYHVGMILLFFFVGLALAGALSGPGRSDPELASLAVAAAVGLVLYGGMGWGLTNLRPWARWLQIVLGSLALVYLSVTGVLVLISGAGPLILLNALGLVISVYILYLVASRKGAVVFSPEYRAAIELTPHIRYQTSWILKGCLFVFLGIVGFFILAAILMNARG